jgi:transposase
MKRHELTDEDWAVLEPLIPQSQARTGRPSKPARLMLNGIMWIYLASCGHAIPIGKLSAATRVFLLIDGVY